MYLATILLLASSARLATSQTPPDAPSFIPATSNHLNVSFGSGDIVAGTLIPIPNAQTQPQISLPSPLSGTFTLIMVDPDARNPNGTARTILHWMQPDLTTATLPFVNTTAPIATYRGPAPPPEIPTRAHRYTQLLYTQPGPVVVPADMVQVVQSRAGFDLARFVQETGLGQVVAANYFLARNDSLVANGTANATATSSPVSVSSSGAGEVTRPGLLAVGLMGIAAFL